MAPQVIDLISSSPPPSQPSSYKPQDAPPSYQQPATSSNDVPQRPDDVLNSTQVAATVADTIAAINVDLLSDDLDLDPFSELDEPISLPTDANKRRRVSPAIQSATSRHMNEAPLNHSNTHGRSTVSGAPVTRRPTTALETIDFTSSIEAKSPQALTRATRRSTPPRKVTSNRTTTAQVARSDHDDSDPFASSPKPLPPRPEPPARLQPAASSDPFASSPRRSPLRARRPNILQQQASSDPFASSPPLHPDPLQASKTGSCNVRAAAIPSSPPCRPIAHRRREIEPISSSAPEAFRPESPGENTGNGLGQHAEVIDIADSDSDRDIGSDGELPAVTSFDLSQPRPRPRPPLRRSRSDISHSKQPKTTKSATQKSATEKAREREAKAAAKEAEKENKRREREQAKEVKARDKERAIALAEVNKLRTDKKVSAPEMIVDLPSGLNDTISVQVKTLLDGIGVQHRVCDSVVPNVIKWRRKVTSRFNDDKSYWEPIPLRIEAVHHVIVTMTADEFVQLALQNGLDSHVSQVKEHHPGHELVYLIEGLTPWLRKNRNIRNRQFTSGVRGQDAASSATAAGRRRNNTGQEYISEDVVEEALLELQVAHDTLIHHTTVPLETAQWITTFTQHISTIPYKKQKDQNTLGAGFCMESGQVRTGDDTHDTYVRMLQEIVRVTAPIAYGVAAEFDSVAKLVSGLEAGGPLRLEGVRKCANKDGAFSDRTVGQAVSRRLHKVFTGQDETSTDV